MRALFLALLLPLGTVPALAQQDEESFTEIVPGDPSSDPGNLMTRAIRGDVRAMNNIGLLFAKGVGIKSPDYQEAMRWWKEAAKHGYALAMNNIGLLYVNGQGVDRDPKKALAWWQRAAELGNAWAMNNIGDLYEQGEGVTQDWSQALAWYQRGAEGGDGLAMYNMGSLNERGKGTAQNFQEALRWYSRSADRGIAYAMHAIGQLMEQGKGTPVDLPEAHAWLAVAAGYYMTAEKDEIARNEQARARLEARLSADELARAQAVAIGLKERIESKRKPPAPKSDESST